MILRAQRLLVGTVAALALGASAVHAGDLYVIHGIPGTDIGQATDALPVDIGINGDCTALNGVEFQQSAPGGSVPAGVYEAQVYLADADPCAGTLAVAADVAVPVSGTVLIIAHLDQNGVPTLSSFTANVGDIAPGLAKLQVIHTAAAVPVDVRLKGKGAKAKISDLAAGDQSFAAQIPAIAYDVQIKPASGGKPVLTLDDVPLSGDAYTAVFAVGAPGGTFGVIPVEIVPAP